MPEITSFPSLLARVRHGDPEAACLLLAEYEPEVRRIVRMRLTDPRLRRTVESMDVCQSVFGNFFVRVAAGQFDLNKPEDLLRLLVRMAVNKVHDVARRQRGQGRDVSRNVAAGDVALTQQPTAERSPGSIVADGELLAEIRRRLTVEENRLIDARAEGRAWDELARTFGKSAEALRKQHRRALDRVLHELGVDSAEDH